MPRRKAGVLGLVIGAVMGTVMGFMYGVASHTVVLGPEHLLGGAIIGSAAGFFLGRFFGSRE